MFDKMRNDAIEKAFLKNSERLFLILDI